MISKTNISQGACFFTVVHACTRSLKEADKKIFRTLKLPLCELVLFEKYICLLVNMYLLTEEG